MATSGTPSSDPGVMVGPTSEFSLFFRVKPGEGESLRTALNDLQQTPGYRPGDYGMADRDDPRGAVRALRRRHTARLHHELRRPLGRLHGGLLQLRTDARPLRRHLPAHRGLRGPARPRRGEGVHPRARSRRAAAYARNYPRHREGDPQGAARERGLPARARPPRRRGRAAASGAAAPARRGRRTDGSMSDHISGPAGAGQPDRRHHRRLRVPEPGAAGTTWSS